MGLKHAAAPARADAGTVLRLAVLLQAGVAPADAWRYLAEAGDAAAAVVAAKLGAGGDVPSAIGALAGWGDVAAAWRIAETVGAPLAESLRGIAAALQDAARTRDEVRIALAEPAGTARLMSWLPLVAVALGAALGFDTLRTLATNPIGIGCALGGVGLILAAHRWNTRLVRRADPDEAVAGLGADLMAIALSGGVSLDRATELVRAAGAVQPDDETRGILTLSHSAGVPAAELLRAAAGLARHRARTDGRMRAARLSSSLLVPLGVCTLPAFLLLGVAPMLLSVLSTTPLSL
ncbi:type II secretion system F family protein [Microbacterium horticulturae]|uniref:Type II secretion system F family protein n=1 Tax=Microbacterium horticulturae TaxID=3028316 RepID=A0ABY8C103_9MICO|nr:type II secretion system F family protein [Microbacterium sp. KACC 23027]WEG09807.1 type II secretion system F family protein [Microbacterium sp. KACC 23027]